MDQTRRIGWAGGLGQEGDSLKSECLANMTGAPSRVLGRMKRYWPCCTTHHSMKYCQTVSPDGTTSTSIASKHGFLAQVSGPTS
mmetsp:Transcript_3662/g.4232  ORF Transcript_3662/g.4232 Transcript_3662/m.4232 type:complete len:84 (+) Transcript_3662:203-454(+)